MLWIYLALSSTSLGIALAQFENEAGSQMTLPPEVLSKLNLNLNDTEIENVKNKYMDQFQKKCEKNGHPETLQNAQKALGEFINCYNSLVDMNVLQQEIEDAKPNGRVDEVFKKYCNKSPQFHGCLRNLTESVKPCFSADEQKNFKTIYNITEQLTEFVCFKDGDRIALFISEGGQECLDEKKEGIQKCFGQVFDTETQEQVQNVTSLEGIMELEFKEKQCNQMTDLQTCVVDVLEHCIKPTSANIIDSLFNFVRKSTPCKNFVKVQKEKSTGSANALGFTLATTLTALATALIL